MTGELADWERELAHAEFEAAERKLGIYHKGDIRWYEAPIPPRFHRCEPQTTGIRDRVSRCACGAISISLTGWAEKNSRRGPWWKFGR